MLTSLIPSVSGWSNLNATGINDQGQIVGQGMITGQEHSLLMTPSAAGAGACGLGHAGAGAWFVAWPSLAFRACHKGARTSSRLTGCSPWPAPRPKRGRQRHWPVATRVLAIWSGRLRWLPSIRDRIDTR